MKILLYGINFSPELTGIGKYSGEMVAWLATQGHDVRVVTAPPYYPNWRVSEPYRSYAFSSEEFFGAKVFRAPLWVPKSPGGLKRLIHLMSFALSSLPLLFWQTKWRPDVVIVIEPPLFCAPAALLFSILTRAKSWLQVQDFEVDAAFDLGLIKGEKLKRVVLAVERGLMRMFGRVSSVSGRMLERAISKGIEPDRLVFFPNWVDISKISPLSGVSLYRHELGISEDEVVALYSGNMGRKQGLEILAEAARSHRDNKKLRFIFCGNGAGRSELELSCSGLENVIFLDLQPMERLGEFLGVADIHLLPQRADAADLVMPSKLTGMLASGKAVLATAATNTELGRVLEGRGMVTPPEDAKAFVDAILLLSLDPALRMKFGLSGRQYAEENLDKGAVLGRFNRELTHFVENV